MSILDGQCRVPGSKGLALGLGRCLYYLPALTGEERKGNCGKGRKGWETVTLLAQTTHCIFGVDTQSDRILEFPTSSTSLGCTHGQAMCTISRLQAEVSLMHVPRRPAASDNLTSLHAVFLQHNYVLVGPSKVMPFSVCLVSSPMGTAYNLKPG
eukprot:1160573-Pelagomonas_calceolata.AAC.31